MNLDKCCHTEPINVMRDDLFTETDVETYLERVWSAYITKDNLDLDYHEKVALTLLEPVFKELGNPAQLTEDEILQQLARNFQNNIYEFSAAKQYQQARAMSAIITPEMDYYTFRKQARDIFAEFNDNYLRAEYNTAVTASQNSKNYVNQVSRGDVLPLLQYKTLGDTRVRDTHAEMDGVIFPVNHPFWRRYYPPNGWNCRCFVISLRADQGKQTNLNDVDLEIVRDETPDLFRQNPALTGELFDKKKHPYFEVERGDSILRDNNFNLPRG